MDKILTLYHGSEHIIKEPAFGMGRRNNDYGPGFYCTENPELAKEWAVSVLSNGFSNRYTIDTENMRILDLCQPEYSILNWIAVLVEHRVFSAKTPVARRAKSYLVDNFSVNVNAYDIVVGYRADDSYFDFAESFINNGITVNQLSKAMYLGKLGEQIVLKSQFAFSRLVFEGFDLADSSVFYAKRKNRDDAAKNRYMELLETEDDGLYIQDIIRETIKKDDPRIPGILSK
jgi:hypothetical protein